MTGAGGKGLSRHRVVAGLAAVGAAGMLGGADTITGSKGHDLILGGKGNDTFNWSAGNYLVFGGEAANDNSPATSARAA